MTNRILISSSLDFAPKLRELNAHLQHRGFEVTLPPTAQKILKGEVTVETIQQEKQSGTFHERSIRSDAIRRYWELIQGTDVLLVANFQKNGIPNYIGGNAFLEMGFAHVLRKRIFLLFDIPEMSYSDEIRAMEPICLRGSLKNLDL
jgi:hypothetical protein